MRRWWLIGLFVVALLVGGGAFLAFQPRLSALAAAPRLENGGPPRAATAAAGPVDHEAYSWQPVAIGAGGFITGLSNDAKGVTRVIRTDTHGAYIWDEGRDRWRQLVDAASMPAADRRQNGMNEGVYEIAVAPSDPDRIYMAIKGYVYRSADRGRSWTRAPDQPPFRAAFNPNGPYRFYGPFLAVSPRNPDLVFFGTPAAGLWRSIDGGVTWTAVNSVPLSRDMKPEAGAQAPGTVIWFEGAKGGGFTGRIWAMAPGSGVFVSADDGATFAPLTTREDPDAPLLLKRGAFAPDGSFFGVDAEGKSVYRFHDGAWSNITQLAGLSPNRYAAIAINPRNGEIFLFDEGGSAFRSSGDGQRWFGVSHAATVGKGDPPWLHVSDQSYFATSDVRFDPAVPDRLWVGAGTGVFYADAPAEATQLGWISQARGVEQLVTTDVIQPPGSAPIFAAWDFGLHIRHDLDAFSTGYGPRERVLIAVQQVDWSGGNPKFLVTNASDTRMSCCWQDGMSVLAGYSEDGGETWQRFASLPQPPGTKADDPWRMSFGMIAVSANDTNNIVWAPSFNRSPFYTKDRGKTWQRVELEGEVLPNTGSHSAYHLPRRTLAADRVRPGTFYLLHSGEEPNAALAGLWRTSDGGAHWQHVHDGEIAPTSRFAAKLRVVPGKAGHLFFTASIEDGPDTRLRRSMDGGETWTALDGVDHVDDVAFGKAARGADYPTIFISGRVGGRYGIWRSVDDAATWHQLTEFPAGRLDQVVEIGADLDVFGRVYVGYMGSGWVYGEPSPCTPAPYEAGSGKQCAAVE